MIKLTPLLYTRVENVDRIEGFVQTACIRITLIDGSHYERYVSEEKLADYADPNGERAKEFQGWFLNLDRAPYDFDPVTGYPKYKPRLTWEQYKAKRPDTPDYRPVLRDEAMELEVALVKKELDDSVNTR